MTTTGHHFHQASDIRADAWIIRLVPRVWRPYLRLMRVDRAIGTWLLLLPCLWSVSLASHALAGSPPDPWYVVLFSVGAFVMRGAGCVVNDLWDRDIDGKVARTAGRPIASGEIKVRSALAFLAGLLLVGLLILLQFNAPTIVLGVASLGLVAVYPLMKRITYWPQAFLGLTFNWGALLAWASVEGGVGWPALLIYAAGFFWTLGYDTVYGHQDKEDDVLVGVMSSSIKLGRNTRPFVGLVYLLTVLLLSLAGGAVDIGWFFYLMLGATAVQFAWQVATLDIDDPKNCLARFKSNRDVGLMIFLGALLG
jgi:4-hydroxybenzoate polyprenyltransferase